MEQQMKIIADAVNEIMRQTLVDREEIERLREDVADLKKLMQSTVNYTGISVSTEKYAFHAMKKKDEAND